MRIAVTDLEYDKAVEVFTSTGPGVQCFRAPAGERELALTVRELKAEHSIVGVLKYNGPLYEALPAGGVIARFGVGYDNIAIHQATARGVLCTNTPGVLDESVAEYAIALLLAAARHVPALASETRMRGWKPRLGRELKDSTLAVIGCGRIGSRVGAMAAAAFGMRVIGHKPAPIERERLIRLGFSDVTDDFAAAVADADFVSLHLPSNSATRHFMNAERLDLLRSDAWLINTARGGVVDEDALYDALSTDRLGGAALDVFESEPYGPSTRSRDLRRLENVIMTPHVASSTREASHAMARRALHNIYLASAQRYDEMDLLNREVLVQSE